ncbi:outer membrane protein [Pararhizobium sp.]|uniref:outer membrane protein n=1 Tax=Pararhizobium sp. TaxID=1977563 RepID=UPI002723FD2B|nr:outer membrane beta-barrel protein [Pararhizobium sp.]MDO9415098.1 outer membrane beta-barrel protein [Pararhizobium sp.]
MLHKMLFGASIGLMLAAQASFAGDLDMISAPEVDIVQSSVGQGWYIRGDLGFAGAIDADKPNFRSLDGAGGYSQGVFDDGRFSKPFSYGAGMGYQFNDYLRADATVDFINGSVDGTSRLGSRCSAGQSVGTDCALSHEADYTGIGLMANGYVDLGTYVGFTPYVGAGVGLTHLAWDDVTARPYCVAGAAACNGTAYNPITYEGKESIRFSYALMAGVAYDLTNRIKFDLGYRYSDIAGGDMYNFSAAENALGASGVKGKDEGFTRHEIRAGIRLNTW